METPPVTAVERPHHPFSPSTLQYREACPCYRPRQSQHARSIAGTIAHGVVESGEDDQKLGDDDAVAAAECIEFKDHRRGILEAERDLAVKAYLANGGRAEMACQHFLAVLELRESYLSVDTCRFGDCTSTTAGYVDNCLLNYNRTYAEMMDWKFGYWAVEDADKNLQGIAYAIGLFRAYPTLEKIRFFFKQPHREHISEALFTRTQIPELYLRVQTVVACARKGTEAADRGDFSMARPVVPVCNFCNRIADCPIHIANALKVAKKFSPLEFPEHIDTHTLMDRHQSSLALKLAATVKIWADSFRSRTTDRVLRGDADIPEGYVIAQSSTRRSISNVEQFKTVALKYVDADTLSKAADYSFGPIEEAITEKAPRGSKKATVEQFQQDLLDTGAVIPGDAYPFLRVRSEKKSEE